MSSQWHSWYILNQVRVCIKYICPQLPPCTCYKLALNVKAWRSFGSFYLLWNSTSNTAVTAQSWWSSTPLFYAVEIAHPSKTPLIEKPRFLLMCSMSSQGTSLPTDEEYLFLLKAKQKFACARGGQRMQPGWLPSWLALKCIWLVPYSDSHPGKNITSLPGCWWMFLKIVSYL